jgi:predicted negative regulator of RcsB-dependent stress response
MEGELSRIAQPLDPEQLGFAAETVARFAQRKAAMMLATDLAMSTSSHGRHAAAAKLILGAILLAEGDRAGARSRYEESLKLVQKVRLITGDTPEALRDVSISLNKVAQVLLAEGDRAGARSRYEDVYETLSRVRLITGDTPQALRDVSVSLNNVAQVLLAEGDRAGARSRYEESLKLVQKVRLITGDTPEAMRDEAISHLNLVQTAVSQEDFVEHVQLMLGLYGEIARRYPHLTDLIAEGEQIVEWLNSLAGQAAP